MRHPQESQHHSSWDAILIERGRRTVRWWGIVSIRGLRDFAITSASSPSVVSREPGVGIVRRTTLYGNSASIATRSMP